ncbi:MAG: hypothetical protein IPP74_09225 [Alphaproteobacteria bacterium]|nr:hypothetical protein [Alphaproteobacteria bacterium]
MKSSELLREVVDLLHNRVGYRFKVTSRPPVKSIEAIECVIEDELTALRAKYYATQHARLLPGIEVALKDLSSPSRRGRKPQKQKIAGFQLCLNFADPDAIRFFHYYLNQKEALITQHEEQKIILSHEILMMLQHLTHDAYKGIIAEHSQGWISFHGDPYEQDFAMTTQEPELRFYHPASAMDDYEHHTSPSPYHAKRSKVLRMISLGIKVSVGRHEPDEAPDHPSPYYFSIKNDSADIIRLLYRIEQQLPAEVDQETLLQLKKKFLLPYKNSELNTYWHHSAPVPDEAVFLEKLNKAIMNAG